MAENVWVKMEKLVRNFLPESAGNFFFIERQDISPQTKSSKTTLLCRAVQWVKKPFFSKKCFFWPENDVFSKKSFYSKLISDQNYIICTCQKIHFQNKIMRQQFSPDSTYSCGNRMEKEKSKLIAKVGINIALFILYIFFFGKYSIQKYLNKGVIIINEEENPEYIPPPGEILHLEVVNHG